jgi:hypothetical protein
MPLSCAKVGKLDPYRTGENPNRPSRCRCSWFSSAFSWIQLFLRSAASFGFLIGPQTSARFLQSLFLNLNAYGVAIWWNYVSSIPCGSFIEVVVPAEENLCLKKAEENLSRQLWVAGVRVFSRPEGQKFFPVRRRHEDIQTRSAANLVGEVRDCGAKSEVVCFPDFG